MTPPASQTPPMRYEVLELLRQSLSGFVPQDVFGLLIDRVEGRK